MTLCPIRLDIDALEGSPFPLLDLATIKLHCAVDFNDQDALIEGYWLAAIEAFESTTHRTLALRQHRWVLREFPLPYATDLYGRIWLPRGKTFSVDAIEYVSAGVTVTLASSPSGTDWQEDLRGDDGGVVMPPQGESWPTADTDAVAPVTITFTAGYLTLPGDVRNALLFYTRTSLDDNRTDPDKAAANLRTFESLVSGYRLSRIY